MIEFLRELYAHEAWADAEHWRAILACEPAARDPKILERLNHINMVQRFFLSLAKGVSITKEQAQREFPLGELLESYRTFHSEALAFFSRLSEDQLAATAAVPWLPNFQPTLREMLTQSVTHSHYHRGQNATRLRELGGSPPLTDYIAWAMKGRPQAEWPALSA